ncbi:MAG TPA: aromatic acid/H+ symport family MFS transporter, partial [Gammaproteobacteria bacterium]|nr:aromatic acid/H+ symport family MFS transporter [Gammaproteobacteria bacterium]
GIPAPNLRWVFMAGNAGVLIGSLVFSMVADKVGRRPVLVWATLFFAVLTIATAYARDLNELLVLRLVAGIGLGSIMPNATALIGEFSPKSSRVALMMTITTGFTVGAAISGFVAAWLIPHYGWRSVFLVGGAIPLVIAAAMAWSLPESLQFLAVRKRRFDQLTRWLKKLDPDLRVDEHTEYVASETSRGGVPMSHLFRDGRGTVTVLIWVANFMNILILYSLSNWLPIVLNGMGIAEVTAVIIGATLQVGGTVGAFGLAWVIARKGFTSTLVATFALAAVSIALIGQPGIGVGLLTAMVFVAGWCIIGGQPGLNSLSASYYPTYLRSTGIGAGLGVGRLGAIVGPYIGGALLQAQWAPQQLFWAAALPALISTVAVLALRFVLGGSPRAPAGAEPAPLVH